MANKKNTKVNAENTTIAKEEAVMAENTKAIAEAEAEAIEEVAGPKEMLLFTASRGKNTKLAWATITVNPEDPTVKVKGCAIELPTQVAEAIGNDKFISYIELATIEKCVAEQKAVRGTASTFSDIYNRYTKVTDAKGERNAVALEVFTGIIEAIGKGIKNGAWERPEPEKAEEAPEAPEAPAEAEVEDPFEVAEG